MSNSRSMLNTSDLLKIYKFSNSTENFHGYLVKSTAPFNVENHDEIDISPEIQNLFLEKYFKIEPNEQQTLFEKAEDIVNIFKSKLPKITSSKYPKKIIANVEQASKKYRESLYPPKIRTVDPSDINEIAKILATSANPELVVRVHGYSTTEECVIRRYYSMVTECEVNLREIDSSKTFVFLGYRWPSEAPNINSSLEALPIFLGLILKFIFFIILSFMVLVIFYFLNQWIEVKIVKLDLNHHLFKLIENPIIILISLLLTSIVFVIGISISTLILLRCSAYFRDTFRATNYAVSDLIALLTELDYAVGTFRKKNETLNKSIKIKISFIGHSMGCYVITNTIRVLSEPFRSLDEINGNETQELSNIGNVFSLGRLVLVAPDISIETVMPRRANFLQSSLKRFDESYIFSSEADVVLRLASTAANYISFPSKIFFGGYRLGNISIRSCKEIARKPKICLNFGDIRKEFFKFFKGGDIEYGIVNTDTLGKRILIKEPFKFLEIRTIYGNKLLTELLRNNVAREQEKRLDQFTKKFTYFDCTDYIDFNQVTGKMISPISLSKRKKSLNQVDYFCILFQHLICKNIDSHGGYFSGAYTSETILRLAFLGFDGLLKSGSSKENECKASLLSKFHNKCKDKRIQVVLSPKFQESIDNG